MLVLLFDLGVRAAPANEAEPEAAAIESLRAAEQQHLEILARLSEAHRQRAAELAALNQQRATLTREIAELTKRRQSEAQALARVEEQRRAAAEQLASLRATLASETARLSALRAEPPPRQSAAPSTAAEQASGSGADPLPPRTGALPEEKRVFVHYSTLHKRGADAARAVANRLVDRGYTLGEIRAVTIPLSAMSVRYFHPSDRDVTGDIGAIAMAALREANVTVASARIQDFTRAPTKPAEGTLEVWVPAE